MKKNSRFLRVAIAAGLVASVGGAVLGVTSFASANNSKIAVVSAASSTDSSTPSADGSANAADAARPDFLATAASVIGISEDALKTELQAGKSIADVAKAHNVDLQKVIDALVAEANSTSLDRITQMVNNPGMPQGGFGRGDHGMHGRMRGQFISDAVTSLLKLSKDEIRTQLQSGKTLADIAKSQGVSVSKLVDAIVADFKTHLDQEVASGEHTQAEADQKLADFKTRVTDIVNGVVPQGMPDGGPDGDGDHGGMPDGDGAGTSSGSGYSGTVTN
jgi:DNA-directed RNA polymerase specialized sigma subunit